MAAHGLMDCCPLLMMPLMMTTLSQRLMEYWTRWLSEAVESTATADATRENVHAAERRAELGSLFSFAAP